ncbi:hypothetical protein [Bradyrhizobium elkanii]|uniref:hypothetical protein n=1 Tax=Bradyrhizobium elkanii TaxID=29448 RepID=UPI002169036B|nr:hypothetical protein [Bradyrhizobium elkanii]MCS3689072.1 hypothetical protein [Bradyrhizobium elkanii]
MSEYQIRPGDSVTVVGAGDGCILRVTGAAHISAKIGEQKLCIGCHKPFEPRRSDALACSNRCRHKAYRERLAAEACE